ncbi:(4Fe-4S)-binding protein [Nocardioides jishulii]|uniref:Divergent 4Fe-4S mono-cluster domain-containing protein n=1 Tax=Nocardioides jishulii TaxID=2575440 RepID=A0A4U2YPP0_9ACTN|nr:(4Fe-4S)-binding protein [Nocardioides jishulii]QCX27795.1 hypothetical protein FCL41_09895 [Nocardioides jishulii]TKI62602.1 hypothetical protein FC770_09560 [Nocardioides jishulii]
MARRTYTGPLVDVSFDRDVCRHAAECVRGMPLVFDPSARPWIDPGRADSAGTVRTLSEVIARCPTGALRLVEHVGG